MVTACKHAIDWHYRAIVTNWSFFAEEFNIAFMNNTILQELAQYAHWSPSADNSQPWRIEAREQSLSVYYDAARVSDKTFPASSPATLLAIGAMLESLITCAESWGMQAHLELAENPGDNSEHHYATVSFGKLPSAASKAPQIARHTNRGSYTRQPVPESLSTALATDTEGEARSWFSQAPADLQHLQGTVKIASWIRFQTQEVHEWLGRSLRFTPDEVAQGDGLDVATLGLPPGGGSFLRLISDWGRMRQLNKLGIYRLLAAIDSAPVGKGPAALAVIAPLTAHATINAGRLMSRQWTRLNEAGLDVHPYYVIGDQLARSANDQIPEPLKPLAGQVRADAASLLKLAEGETLHMLLRVGYARKKAIRSRRVPLNRVFKAVID
tara:strand:+ start:16320 stop:17468 length:1149 start_codon:yes stop_codon:yes gene_type:complete